MSKKYLFLGLLIISFLIAPLSTRALTTAEQIAQLQQQILMLQEQLRQLQNQQPNTWCHTFNVSFGVGTNSQDVRELHTALGKEGFPVLIDKDINGVNRYNENTASAVSRFQLKYQSEILAPLGLTTPTGYVGPSTRRVLNRLYGCGNVVPQPQVFITPKSLPPVIEGQNRTDIFAYSYNQKLQAHGFSSGSLQWSIINGSLPTGFGLEKDYGPIPMVPPGQPWPAMPETYLATIGGVSRVWNLTPGVYTFTVQATNGTQTARQTYSLTVLGAISGNLPPVISGVSGPTSLNVGQTGTWTVNASDPENGQLWYYVDWGDRVIIDYGGIGANGIPSDFRQTTTFTHTYSTAGNYTAKFLVRDTAGQSAQTSLSVVVGTNANNRITVLTPKGGEVWPIGSWQDIVFKLPDNFVDPKIAPMNVGVSFENGPTNGFVINATDLQQMSDGSFRIKTLVRLAPINQNSQPILRPGQYKVKLELFETIAALPCIGCVGISSGLLAVGISDGYVTVDNSPQTITVTSPNGGEQWVANSTHAITWRYNGATNTTKVDLYLYRYQPCHTSTCIQIPNPSIVLDKNIPAGTAYNWIVATDIVNNAIPTGNYYLDVCSAGSLTNCDSSDNYFTITN
ncbi:MAG: peptidoglycan-binding domain-containing protein [Candidatus Vogelbacteria bacterium]